MKIEPIPSVAGQLAARLAHMAEQPLSPRATAAAIRCIADTVGVALAGAAEPCVTILLDTPGVADATGQSLVWGGQRRTSALEASLVNGTASHALDYDDLCAAFGGHHSAPLVAPLFALADQRACSGEALLKAYAAGVETEVRLARAVLPEHYDKGWHPTSTLGVLGVAAASAALLGLDIARTATALSIAASMASGIKANFGSMVKPLHVGMCARSGLLAALLAERGFDAGAQSLEGRQGFFDVYNGPGKFDIGRMFDHWGSPLEIEGDTVGIKQFACCGSTHAAAVVALEMVEQHDIRPADIESVEILPNANRLVHTDKPHPRTPLDAKFSVQYVVTRAIFDRSVKLDDFTESAIAEPALVDFLHRVQARPHPDMPRTGDKLWGAEIRMRLRDGREVAHTIDNLSCRDATRPMSEAELWTKFDDCASRRLPAAQAAQLYDRLMHLDALDDTRIATDLMRA